MAYEQFDFIPKQTTFDSFYQISDRSDEIPLNSIVINLLNEINMEEGTNMIFPHRGLKNLIMEIPYSEDVDDIASRLKERVDENIGYGINFKIEPDPKNKEIWRLYFKIENAIGSGEIKFKTARNGYAKIVDLRYIQ